MDDLVTINKVLTVNTLEAYLEKHPEDTQKWLDHLDPVLNAKRSRYPLRNRGVELLPADYEHYQIVQEHEAVFTNDEFMCGFCKKTWESTSAHAVTTLLCGHKYHTLCCLVNHYDSDRACIVEGCDINTNRIVREIYNRRVRFNETVENVLIDAVKETAEFKADIKKLKGHISIISKKYSESTKFQKRLKNKLMNKHIFNIRQIQYDMNASSKAVKTSSQYLSCVSEIKKYRATERKIYRKYHVDLRDLIQQRIVKVGNWQLRYALQRHANILRPYKFGIRIYPGSNKWQEKDDDDSDDVGSTVEENELITE